MDTHAPPARAPEGRARRRAWHVVLAAATLAVLAACGTADDPSREAAPRESTGQPSVAATPVADRPRIVALGDSLTAGYGLPSNQGYPSVLQQLLDEAGYRYEVVNMGVSGDTSAGGLRRVDWALEGDVRVVIVALGGNDGLRGLSPADLERNLGGIIDRARARGIPVLLCGMEAPPNLGASYTREFRAVYPRLAKRDGVTLLPFLLDGVAGDPSLNQADGIHPNADGARRMATLVLSRLEPLLDRRGTS